jgi:hypothetical protein
MPLYFFLLDGPLVHGQIMPALAAAWQQRSFTPCQPLCARLVPAALAYAEQYHMGPDEPLLRRIAQGTDMPAFHRDVWRFLAGEVLLYAAGDMPVVQTAPETLCQLLAPECAGAERGPWERFAPVQQAHYGSRDLAFGSGFYRPEHAGYNDTNDVTRLAEYLAGIDPKHWTTEDLAVLQDLSDEEERAEELAFARQCLAVLRDIYERAARASQVVVCETL